MWLSSTALALPFPGWRAAVSSWVRRKQCWTTLLFPSTTKVQAAWTASSDTLVKNREAKSISSSEKPLLSADMILIAWSRISVSDGDADERLDGVARGWEGVGEIWVVWNSIGAVTVEGGARAFIGVVETVAVLKVLSITSMMWLLVKLRDLERITGFK